MAESMPPGIRARLRSRNFSLPSRSGKRYTNHAFMRYALAVALLAGVETFSLAAFADRGDQNVSASASDKTKGLTAEASTESKPSPWRGSILLFDQSATTQTFGLGKDYLSS